MRVTQTMCDCTLYDGSYCNKAARYVIDGVNLCTQHAGPIAIVRLLALNQAEKIAVINKSVRDPLCNLSTMFDWRRDKGNTPMFTGKENLEKCEP